MRVEQSNLIIQADPGWFTLGVELVSGEARIHNNPIIGWSVENSAVYPVTPWGVYRKQTDILSPWRHVYYYLDNGQRVWSEYDYWFKCRVQELEDKSWRESVKKNYQKSVREPGSVIPFGAAKIAFAEKRRTANKE